MEFVYMRHPNVGTARFPVSSVRHWSGYGWEECDPPPKPARPPRRVGKPPRVRAPRPTSDTRPAPVVETPRVDTEPVGKKPATKTQKAPSGRKEE